MVAPVPLGDVLPLWRLWPVVIHNLVFAINYPFAPSSEVGAMCELQRRRDVFPQFPVLPSRSSLADPLAVSPISGGVSLKNRLTWFGSLSTVVYINGV